MMTATPTSEKAVEVLFQDPMGWLVVPCHDYQTFKGLPLVLVFQGKRYSRKGWNSDTEHGFYSPGDQGVAYGVQS
jgi:hypothetical protein